MEGYMTIAREGKKMPFFETKRNTESFSVSFEVKNGIIYAKSKNHTYTIDLTCALSCDAAASHNIDTHETSFECKKVGYMIDNRVVCSGLRLDVRGDYQGDGDKFKKILSDSSFYVSYCDNEPDLSRDV